MGLQPLQDRGRVVARIALGDPAPGEHRVGLGQRPGRLVGEAEAQRVRRVHRRAGEGEVRADLARHPGQQRCHEHVGKQPDLGLRHGQAAARVHHALRAVRAQPEPAAHRDAGHHRPVRLREGGHGQVDGVLGLEELAHVTAAEGTLPQRAHVRARAEPALPRSGQLHRSHPVVRGQLLQHPQQGAHHRDGEGVDLAGTVQPDPPDPVHPFDQQLPGTHPSAPVPPAARCSLRSWSCR